MVINMLKRIVAFEETIFLDWKFRFTISYSYYFLSYVIDFQDKKDWKKNQHKLHQVNSELMS